MARNPFDDALAAEGVDPRLAGVARSIYKQESGSGKNTKTSNAGAVGGMQIIPSTFASVADKGWDINNPEHNMRAGIRYIKQLDKQAGGDPILTAAGYYGGPGGLEKARKGIAVSDPRNPNAPNTLQYAQQVAARLGTPAPSYLAQSDKEFAKMPPPSVALRSTPAQVLPAAIPDQMVAQAMPVPVVVPQEPQAQPAQPAAPVMAAAQPDPWQMHLEQLRASQAPVQVADLAYGGPAEPVMPQFQRPDFMAALSMMGQVQSPNFRPFTGMRTKV